MTTTAPKQQQKPVALFGPVKGDDLKNFFKGHTPSTPQSKDVKQSAPTQQQHKSPIAPHVTASGSVQLSDANSEKTVSADDVAAILSSAKVTQTDETKKSHAKEARETKEPKSKDDNSSENSDEDADEDYDNNKGEDNDKGSESDEEQVSDEESDGQKQHTQEQSSQKAEIVKSSKPTTPTKKQDKKEEKTKESESEPEPDSSDDEEKSKKKNNKKKNPSKKKSEESSDKKNEEKKAKSSNTSETKDTGTLIESQEKRKTTYTKRISSIKGSIEKLIETTGCSILIASYYPDPKGSKAKNPNKVIVREFGDMKLVSKLSFAEPEEGKESFTLEQLLESVCKNNERERERNNEKNKKKRKTEDVDEGEGDEEEKKKEKEGSKKHKKSSESK